MVTKGGRRRLKNEFIFKLSELLKSVAQDVLDKFEEVYPGL